MYQYLEDILHDCRKLPEMCRALPVTDLRQMVHDYHYSDLLLENEIFGSSRYKDGERRSQSAQDAIRKLLTQTKHPELVRWRDMQSNRLRVIWPLYPTARLLSLILHCYTPCVCLRTGCYFSGSYYGTRCVCGWPIPVY